MSIRYDENTKARAVRLVREHRDDYESEWAAMKAISGRLGMNPETLRKWVRQTEIDAGEAPGVSSEERRELRELRRKSRELEATAHRDLILLRPPVYLGDVGVADLAERAEEGIPNPFCQYRNWQTPPTHCSFGTYASKKMRSTERQVKVT